MADLDPKPFLKNLFAAAVGAALPKNCMAPNLVKPPQGRTLVLGAGKASAAMAEAFEADWPGEISGLVLTRYGYGKNCKNIEIVEAAHPIPDAAGENAARRMLAMTEGLGQDDLAVCLLSGGGSALLSVPLPGVTSN
ncbi:MAG: glycerate-2-kinase family protein, partial [Rhodospirillales bacterium]|nr:glycerate-2-kinase family protein [Rhodospirillales bacterium]